MTPGWAAREGDAAERLVPGRDPWSDAFVDESMRVRLAVHSLVRPLTAPLAVAGQELSPGVVLVVPVPLLHGDRRIFEAPDSFRPERFVERPAPETFLPFGTGARRCLGQALAPLQMQALVPAILSSIRLTAMSGLRSARSSARPYCRRTAARSWSRASASVGQLSLPGD